LGAAELQREQEHDMVQTPPNVVLIMVDDADRKLFDHIPRIRAAVAQQGATVPDYFLNQPLCGPSRATILRGQYSHNTGVVENVDAYGHFVANGGENSNLATWLHGGGYRTALVGKYINGYASDAGYPKTWVPQGWDYWFSVFNDSADSYDFEANDNGTLVQYGHERADYGTDVLTRKALEFLDSDLADGPFFMLVATKAPHSPAIPAPEYEEDFAGVTYPRGAANPSFNEDDVRDKPFYVSKLKKLDAQQIALVDQRFRQRMQCMESVEDMVEAIIAALGSRLNNTYIIFTSDNGFHMGEHRLGHGANFPGGKNTPYEEDISVPMWIRGPGITPGRTVTQLVGNVDIAPTICQMAGVTPGLDVDGRSFLPLVQGTSIPWRSRYLVERGGDNRAFTGIRSADRTVFTEFEETVKGEVPGEYYDLAADPFELANQYNNLPSSKKSALRKAVKDYRKCKGNSCRVADA
jgi:arylsulfatase A-like enzyme